MLGGLLQFITKGKQDMYLTSEPEITFFKKSYKKHTNFSTYYKTFYSLQDINFGSDISFKIENVDAVHNCYLEINIPEIKFNDSHITDSDYISYKSKKIQLIKDNIQYYTQIYNNLSKYHDIQIHIYSNVKKLLKINNITLEIIQERLHPIVGEYKITLDSLINIIETEIIKHTNVEDYIFSLDKNSVINIHDIDNSLDNLYGNCIFYLKLNKTKINTYINELNTIQSDSNIDFSFCENIGHNMFNNYNLNVGGIDIQNYTKDTLNIIQSHKIIDKNNYDEMIGNTKELTTFNNNTKGGRNIYVPLIFWFNKDIENCLPVLALSYSDIILTVSINEIENILKFRNYYEMAKSMFTVTQTINYVNNIIIDHELDYNTYEILYSEGIVIYHCNSINNRTLELKYPTLSNVVRDDIINIYGYNKKINLEQWIKLLIDKKYVEISYYDKYIDYNYLYSTIPEFNIKLICEIIYFDKDEREKFITSHLEYTIESYDEYTYTIKNPISFECEIGFGSLCKELYWYIKPVLDGNDLQSELSYSLCQYITEDIMDIQNVIFDKEELYLSKDENYFRYLQSYKYLNNLLEKGIYYYSFCLFPKISRPTGSINLKTIKNKQYSVLFNKEFIRKYENLLLLLSTTVDNLRFKLKFISNNYDILIINKGRINILFKN